MRYLGLDLGTKTLGMALTDKTGTIATPLKVVHFNSNDYDVAVQSVKSVLEEYDIKKIALGLPKNMNNSEGFACKRSMEFQKRLASITDIPVVLVDERLSTVMAHNILLDADLSRQKRKKVVDGLAAQIILETFIKMEENKNE